MISAALCRLDRCWDPLTFHCTNGRVVELVQMMRRTWACNSLAAGLLRRCRRLPMATEAGGSSCSLPALAHHPFEITSREVASTPSTLSSSSSIDLMLLVIVASFRRSLLVVDDPDLHSLKRTFFPNARAGTWTIATIFCDGYVGGRWRAMAIASASDEGLHRRGLRLLT